MSRCTSHQAIIPANWSEGDTQYILKANDISFGNIISDIPIALRDSLKDDKAPKSMIEAAVQFVNHRISPPVDASNFKDALTALQEVADDHYKNENLAVTRTPFRWTPAATRDFLTRVGPYLPVPLALSVRPETL